MEPTPSIYPNGTHIVIADRGFVWVGRTTVVGSAVVIENARNIRIWGTTEGLGQLINGPLRETKLDTVGKVVLPLRAVIAFIVCTREW